MSRYITIPILCIIVMLHVSNDVLNTVYLFDVMFRYMFIALLYFSHHVHPSFHSIHHTLLISGSIEH